MATSGSLLPDTAALAEHVRRVTGVDAPIKPGNSLPIKNIPLGTQVHCIELKPGKGAQLARSAGAGVQIVAREGEYVTVRLRSGELRKVHVNCRATILPMRP